MKFRKPTKYFKILRSIGFEVLRRFKLRKATINNTYEVLRLKHSYYGGLWRNISKYLQIVNFSKYFAIKNFLIPNYYEDLCYKS